MEIVERDAKLGRNKGMLRWIRNNEGWGSTNRRSWQSLGN